MYICFFLSWPYPHMLCWSYKVSHNFAGEPGAPGLAGITWQVVLHIVQGAPSWVPVLDFLSPAGAKRVWCRGRKGPKCWVVLACGTRL